jgi:hypothetical protein
VWTPRRIVLLIAGVVFFTTAYAAYARFLGWIDGLPQLPAEYLVPAKGEIQPPARLVSPTHSKLQQAFGPGCREVESPVYANRFEVRDRGMVFAVGPFVTQPDGRVMVSPFSVALFGKAGEITTLHGDKAFLEFDPPIKPSNPRDMGESKLVAAELHADPGLLAVIDDPRRGKLHVTANRRTLDPADDLLIRTPGPIFYREAPQP